MREPVTQLAATAALSRSARVLTERLSELEARVQGGEETAWSDYTATVQTLALLLPALSPEARGQLLTTAEMAARLNIKPKTLLKRKARGEVRPAVQAGKLIRWRGSETV